MAAEINFFKDEFRFLSNFADVSVFLDEMQFPSVEHAYVAAKTLDMVLRHEIQICPNAGKVKRLGKKIAIRLDWDEIKVSVMKTLTRQKFNQEPFKSALLATGDAFIREGNTWGDVFWGQTVNKNGEWCGENNLGIILMNLRDELRT